MSAPQSGGPVYTCPMHKNVRQAGPGECPQCGMALLPEGARFAFIRHMLSSPLHLIVMGGVMLTVMAALMMWR